MKIRGGCLTVSQSCLLIKMPMPQLFHLVSVTSVQNPCVSLSVGVGGTGKSYPINILRKWTTDTYQKKNEAVVAVCAPTGLAAH